MSILTLRDKRAWLGIVLLLADGIFFFSINPKTTAPSILIAGFILLLITGYYIFKALLSVLSAYSKRLRAQRQRLAVLLTIIGGSLLALQSIGQLTFRDALVLVPLAIVLYIYMTYARFRPSH